MQLAAGGPAAITRSIASLSADQSRARASHHESFFRSESTLDIHPLISILYSQFLYFFIQFWGGCARTPLSPSTCADAEGASTLAVTTRWFLSGAVNVLVQRSTLPTRFSDLSVRCHMREATYSRVASYTASGAVDVATTTTAVGREPRRCARTVLTALGKSTLRVRRHSPQKRCLLCRRLLEHRPRCRR